MVSPIKHGPKEPQPSGEDMQNIRLHGCVATSEIIAATNNFNQNPPTKEIPPIGSHTYSDGPPSSEQARKIQEIFNSRTKPS